MSAAQFAALEGVSARTLSWWSSTLRRGTRAERGLKEAALAPIEIALPPRDKTRRVEIEVGDAIIRVEVGTDAEYVCEIVRRLAGRS